ncbi:MAG: homoserine O-acetyltransferase [Firmicutes bacterium]|nr:homoserine O-acetyltransferase [Bacillota bacterium]
MVLESGAKLGPITIAYETYGELSPARDNAILITHALTGDAHCASHGPDDPEAGWWEPLVGPGRVFDTDRYFVICSNVLGGCQGSTGPASIDPETGRPYGARFPVVTIGDMVRCQERLVRHLGIDRLFAVAGGSMGGMQALEWAVRFPDMVRGVIPIATPARSYPQAIAFNEVGRQAILNDPGWRGGDYYGTPGPERGLAIARMLGMITYQSDPSMTRKFGRELVSGRFDDPFSLFTTFQVESYLHYQGKKLVNRFDANSYLYLTRALDLFDLSRGFGSLERALERVQAPMLVVGVSSDILYPVYQQKEIVAILQAQGKAAEYAEIDSPHGHDGFLIDFPQMEPFLRAFLERIERAGV